MTEETTKIVIMRCQDCYVNDVQILCNESAKIVAVRCPECYRKFRMKDYENPKTSSNKNFTITQNKSSVPSKVCPKPEPEYHCPHCKETVRPEELERWIARGKPS